MLAYTIYRYKIPHSGSTIVMSDNRVKDASFRNDRGCLLFAWSSKGSYLKSFESNHGCVPSIYFSGFCYHRVRSWTNKLFQTWGWLLKIYSEKLNSSQPRRILKVNRIDPESEMNKNWKRDELLLIVTGFNTSAHFRRFCQNDIFKWYLWYLK